MDGVDANPVGNYKRIVYQRVQPYLQFFLGLFGGDFSGIVGKISRANLLMLAATRYH